MQFTDKKNQHYVPKFYLRNFSYCNNEKQIGIYNLNAQKFIKAGPLKTQCSKSFFYGYDGVIEDWLSNLEGKISCVTNEIIKTLQLPEKDSIEHFKILAFVALTHLRNPAVIGKYSEWKELINQAVKTEYSETRDEDLFPPITHEYAVSLSLSMLKDIIKLISDLNIKLIINKTSTPFITSDFTVVKYNQFLELKKWPHGRTGYGNVGLQIFIPINSYIMLVLYDSSIYKVGFKKQKILEIKELKDVNQLNLLQVMNCFETIFFNESITENYIKNLISVSNKKNKPNQVNVKMNYIINDDEEKPAHKNLVMLGQSPIEMSLNISGINFHSGAGKYKFDDFIAQVRPWVKSLYDDMNN